MQNILKKLDLIDYLDSFSKYTILKKLLDKGFNIEKDWDKFEQMTAQEVLDYYEY